MDISIKNYKNIKQLNFKLEENKINFMFGISGTGKSSIVSAISGINDESIIPYGKSAKDVSVNIKPLINEEDIALFNESKQNNLLLNREKNENIYSVIFANDSSLKIIHDDIEKIILDLNSVRFEMTEYVNNVEKMISKINGRKLKTDGKFSASSSIEKIKEETRNKKYIKYSKFIHDNGLDYVKWLEEGTGYSFYENEKCPFCIRKLSKSRNDKINEIIKITPENYKLIVDSEDILNKISIEVPNFSYKREINKLEKELYESITNMNLINSIYQMIDSFDLDSLNINDIKEIKLSDSLKNIFPRFNEIINNFNLEIKNVRNKLGILKRKTVKLMSGNLKKINEYLEIFSLPYTFEIGGFDQKNKRATLYLVSKEENTHKDRMENLSYGERNLISLLLFLITTQNKVLIIDDPASSYDDNKRKAIYELLYEFHNDNRTFIVLSHDQVFIKYALLNLSKESYSKNTGKILCLENKKGLCCAKDIESSDFDSLEKQVKEFMNNDLSYYRKIINLRILTEINKRYGKLDQLSYSYLSAILHRVPRNDILLNLKEKEITEEEILLYINEKYPNAKLDKIPDDIFIGFNYDELNDIEKIVYMREELKGREKKILKKEFDDIVHLNTRYFVSLNPYKFSIYSNSVLKLI